MNDIETNLEPETTPRKPRNSRKRNEERRVFVYRMLDGKPKEQGAFPEAAIGSPLERRLPMFLREMFGVGEYRAEIRKASGHYVDKIDVSIATETERENQNIIEVEPEEFDDEPEEFEFQTNAGQMNSVEVENLLLKERLKRFEDDLHRQKSGNQSEMQTLISALEESRREQRELMMMMISQSQKPQQDATTQAMNLLEKSFGMVTKARAISDELAPPETESNGSFMGDAAKLVDSLGRNAGQFLPMLMRNRGSASPTTPRRAATTKTSNENAPSELGDLLNKVKSKKEDEKK